MSVAELGPTVAVPEAQLGSLAPLSLSLTLAPSISITRSTRSDTTTTVAKTLMSGHSIIHAATLPESAEAVVRAPVAAVHHAKIEAAWPPIASGQVDHERPPASIIHARQPHG